MREHRRRPRLHAGHGAAVLPAEGATLATSLSRGLMLVAHTGKAHLGLPVDRAFLRDLARAQSLAPLRTTWGSPDESRVPPVDVPDAVPFRHATSHSLELSRGRIHLSLHAVGDQRRPDVHVELQMSDLLLGRLAQHQNRRYRRERLLTLACLLIVTAALVVALVV